MSGKDIYCVNVKMRLKDKMRKGCSSPDPIVKLASLNR